MTLIINGKTYEAGELVAYVNKLEQDNAELKDKCNILDKSLVTSTKNNIERQKIIDELKGEADSVLDNWCRGDDPCPHLKRETSNLPKQKILLKSFWIMLSLIVLIMMFLLKQSNS